LFDSVVEPNFSLFVPMSAQKSENSGANVQARLVVMAGRTCTKKQVQSSTRNTQKKSVRAMQRLCLKLEKSAAQRGTK